MSEVALAVVLVIGAGLLLRSFWNLMTVDAGFNRSRLVTFGLVLPSATYESPQGAWTSSRGWNRSCRRFPACRASPRCRGFRRCGR